MSESRFCGECGAPLTPGDRFCGECGFDINSMAGKSAAPDASQRLAAPPPTYQQPQQSNQQFQTPTTSAEGLGSMPGRNYSSPGTNSSGSKKALIIMVSVLALLFLAGGGVYWWLSKDKPGGDPGASEPAVTQQNDSRAASADGQNIPAVPDQPTSNVDLFRAATYLSEPGLKCKALVNYPDGTVGVVERISGRVVSNEAVRVSEVEIGVDMGEEYGFGFHYVERADGTYYIMDDSPNEIFPILKNNLTIGQTWNYQDEYGQITWTVMDMGVNLDLGFSVIENCLIVHEDNRAADFQSLTYYAPGLGVVAVKNPGGKDDYYKLTAINTIDAAQAADTVKKWSPNYSIIKDDRTQY